MTPQNPLDRRAERLGLRMERRTEALVRRLTEPAPPFRVPVNEQDQMRRYLDLREAGGLGALRESRGGPHADSDVDRYVARMEGMLSKHAPDMVLRNFREPSELNQNPFQFHEGLVAALGLDGDAPSVERVRAEVEDEDATTE